MGSTAASGALGWQRVVEDLICQRGDALSRYALLLCGNADDAADLVQDALVATFGRLRNGLTLASAEAYVRRSILNAWLDRCRRRTVWRRIAHLINHPPDSEQESPATDSRLDLFAELRRLPARQRACIVLRYYEDLTVDSIAEWLGISAGAVKRYLSDGLRTMQVALAEPTTVYGRGDGDDALVRSLAHTRGGDPDLTEQRRFRHVEPQNRGLQHAQRI